MLHCCRRLLPYKFWQKKKISSKHLTNAFKRGIKLKNKKILLKKHKTIKVLKSSGKLKKCN
jgi:hypothetical protein